MDSDTKLVIECPKCKDFFKENWTKVLEYRGVRPGMEWGIDRVRFYALPIIYCAECHCKCDVSLTTGNIILQTG